MKINLTELLIFFDELTPVTDEERGFYWFETTRPDGIKISFIFSIYESYVSVIVQTDIKTEIASVRLTKCSEIRVLDEKRKCLEILHANGTGRCFLSLLEGTILSYDD